MSIPTDRGNILGYFEVVLRFESALTAGESVLNEFGYFIDRSRVENEIDVSAKTGWHIDELFDKLEDAMVDAEAQMGLKMAARLQDVVDRLADHLTHIFSGISAMVALTPIPISDIYILLILQAVLVSLIASLSGRDISLETAKEFILSMGGVAGAGYAFRLAAQQAVKLFNGVFPGSGSAISSGIAAFGTSAIGKAAIAHYIDGKDIKEAKKLFKNEKKKGNKA